MAKKSKQEEWAEPVVPVVPAYLPPEPEADVTAGFTPENSAHLAPEPTPGLGPDPITLATAVTPKPLEDEAVWDGQHWTHSGRVWDGSSWVASPELLADRRAQATERFQMATVSALRAIAYALLSLLALTFAAAAVVLPRVKDYEAVSYSALGVAALLALVSLAYLWRRTRSRSRSR